MKRLSRKLHLWVGLLTGIFVFFIGLSGSVYVFNDEIITLLNRDAMYIEKGNAQPLEIDTVLSKLKVIGFTPKRFTYSKNETKSFYVLAENTDGKLRQLYFNPYTGEIIKESSLHSFFDFVESFHTELFLGAPGRTFIGIITLLFFVLLITGLIVWLPSKWNKKSAKNAFVLKLGKNKKASNYNLHRILGIYIVIPSIILSFTGAVMAFDPFEMKILDSFGADSNYERFIENIETESVNDSLKLFTYQNLLQSALGKSNNANEIRISIPENNNAKFIFCEYGNNFGMKYAQKNYRSEYFDRTNGQPLILKQPTKDALGFTTMISELHTGKMLGLTYKIFLFFVGIIVTSLPITGFVIWRNKSRNKRKHN